MSSSSVSATAIPSNRSKSFSTPAHSPQLMTPTSTPPALAGHYHHHHGPPSFAEQRLQQLLMNCEAGTHSFQRGDGDDYGPAGRQPNHGGGGSVPGPSAGSSSSSGSGSGSGTGAASGELRRKSFAAGEGTSQNSLSRCYVNPSNESTSPARPESESETFVPIVTQLDKTIWRIHTLPTQFSSCKPPTTPRSNDDILIIACIDLQLACPG